MDCVDGNCNPPADWLESDEEKDATKPNGAVAAN